MSSKKFINQSKNVVSEQLEAFAMCDPDRISLFPGVNVLVRSDYELVKQRKVMVLTGGGSGHEPGFGGYVGNGFMAATVCGEVFASPSESAVLEAIRSVCGSAGCLIIIMNYTGDRLNFGMAMERAKIEGFKVEMLVVGDDCALPRSKGITGRRGIAGTILVQKVACAAADSGLSLELVLEEASNAALNVGSMGIALSVCSLPGHSANDRLDDRTIEIGLGIHGEPGVHKQHLVCADELSKIMVDSILDGHGNDPYVTINRFDEVAVLINNLGGSTKMEEMIVARGVLKYLVNRGILAVRIYCGHYLTALDMCGISVSLMKLDKLRLARLDQTCSVPAWHEGTCPSIYAIAPKNNVNTLSLSPAHATIAQVLQESTEDEVHQTIARGCVIAASQALIQIESDLDKWDAICGDGDCGSTFGRGARALLENIDSMPIQTINALFSWIANVSGKAMGGTSGALVQIYFNAAAGAAHKGWDGACSAGVKALCFHGGASEGMRTLLDALIPFSNILQSEVSKGPIGMEKFALAVAAARNGAEMTRNMSPQAGRANYVEDNDTLKGIPDPGAMAVVAVLEAIRGIVLDM